MRNLKAYSVYFIVVAFILAGCPQDAKPPYEFKEQELQGEIDNNFWEYVSGVARPSLSSMDTLSVGIYNIEMDTPCSYAVSEEGVLFKVPNKVGLYILNADWNNFQAITLYNGMKKTFALGGAVEITMIDSVSNIIEGRIDARVDNNSYINGNFLISLCD